MYYATEIMKNPYFCALVADIEHFEEERIYCRHGMAHLMDVCRLAWVLCLEDLYKMESTAECGADSAGNDSGRPELDAARDRMFVAGLLHDIGRGVQYQTGEHHASAGARLAEEILSEIDYPQTWKDETVEIIRFHCGRHRHLPDGVTQEDLRQLFDGSERENSTRKMVLADYICRADHLSRPCFCCAAADTCKWTADERNQALW